MKKILKKVGGLNSIEFRFFLIIVFFITIFSKNAKTALVNDYEIESLLNEIIEPVIISSKLNLKKPYFYIILSDIPNAYVDPFNRIFITTSFISITSPESLVGVLAHEIAHIKLHHIQKRISNIKEKKSLMDIASILSLSASILSNDSSIFIGSNIASSEMIKKDLINYSKDQEREADIMALKYLENSNITSQGLVDLLSKLLRLQEKSGFNEKEFDILTHPYKASRIKYIKDFQENSQNNNSFFSKDIHYRYELIRQKINGYTKSLDELEIIYGDYKDDKDYALAISYAREGYIDNSIKHMNQLIKSFDKNPYFYETKGEILLSFGYSDEAFKFFNKSLNMNKNNDYLRIRIIEILFNKMQNQENAIEILDEYNNLKVDTSKNNKILKILSQVYKTLKKYNLMNIYLAKFEINQKNYNSAKNYLFKAEELTKDKDTLKEIDKLKKIIQNE